MKKRLFSIFFAAVSALLCCLPLSAAYLEAPDAPDTGYTRAAVMYHLESGTLLYAKNPDMQLYPASTVKLMTAILTAEHFAGALDTTVTVSSSAVRGIAGNYIQLAAGERTTVEALLCAMIIGGANDAANVLAEAVSGSIPDFVALMNDRAHELGCENTCYMNPTGVDEDGAYTTAADTARIAMYASSIDIIAGIAGERSYVMPATNTAPERTIRNRNYFISTAITDQYRRSDIIGLNAGSSKNGGASLVATADNGSYNYLCVVLGASTDSENIYSYTIASDLLDWAYKSYNYSAAISRSDLICEVPVLLSSGADYVVFTPAEDIDFFMPKNFNVLTDVRVDYVIEDEVLTAPVEKGQKNGTVTVYDRTNGEIIGSTDLIAVSNVDRSELKYRLNQLKELFVRPTTLAIAAVCAAAAFVAVVVTAYRRARG
jgi:D-alanyl-D-alanine carboxypeptidase (penicillin-binding protein 5/6)